MDARVFGGVDSMTVVAPLPGLEPGEIDVCLTAELLTIRAADRHACSVALPATADSGAATAVYSYGVLVVAIPLGAVAASAPAEAN